MIRVEMGRWQQTAEDLRLASLNEPHPRSRERFQALYLIAAGQFHATACAAHIGRQDETVLRWVHLYNRHGPNALAYHHTGGRAPLLPSDRSSRLSPPWRPPTLRSRACLATAGR
jgi:Homeodomain-like domain-containing protein